ncbi:MAG: SsrA-binding protein SmpB [bacterium]|nr:SsrA-binding protein SmpB [bacterium]
MKIVNQQAKFDYEIKDRVEAGMVLTGAEAKSAKSGAVDLSRAFCKVSSSKFKAQEVWVHNLHIYPYKHADNAEYDPKRARKLLLHQKEIISLLSRMKQSRLLLVPTAIYTRSGMVKLEIGLARGKRIYEKREAIKKRDLDRDMEREF